MYKNIFAGGVLAALLLLVPAIAQADAAADVEQLEQRRIQALIDADMPALYAIYAEEFFYNVSGGNSLTRAEYLPMYESGELKVHKSDSEARDVRIYGDTAVVTGIVHVNATVKGESRDIRMRYLNLWVKRPSGWVLVARQSTNIPKQN